MPALTKRLQGDRLSDFSLVFARILLHIEEGMHPKKKKSRLSRPVSSSSSLSKSSNSFSSVSTAQTGDTVVSSSLTVDNTLANAFSVTSM